MVRQRSGSTIEEGSSSLCWQEAFAPVIEPEGLFLRLKRLMDTVRQEDRVITRIKNDKGVRDGRIFP